MTLTQKGTRVASAETTKYILESDHKIVVSSVKEKEDDKNLESKKRKKAIAEWIVGNFKPPLRNKDEEYEGKEEDVGDPLASTDGGSPGEQDNEGRDGNHGYDNIYNCEDTVHYDVEDNK